MTPLLPGTGLQSDRLERPPRVGAPKPLESAPQSPYSLLLTLLLVVAVGGKMFFTRWIGTGTPTRGRLRERGLWRT